MQDRPQPRLLRGADLMAANLLDRAVAALSPTRGAERMRARIVADQLQANSSLYGPGLRPGLRSETRWRGASQTLKSMASWVAHLGSGRSDLPRYERERMAARSFDAYRNHMFAGAAVTRMRTNVVGTGLVMHPNVDAEALGLSEERADEINSMLAREWALYYDNPLEVDLEGTLDGAGLQALALVSALLGGDVWASTPARQRPGGLYETKIQLIDGARVSNPNGGPDDVNLLDGVQLDIDGMPIGIHVCNRHPADKLAIVPSWQYLRLYGEATGARRVFQVWNEKDRIGATRGAPFLAPILEPLQMLEQYTRAELTAALVSSLFTVFIKKTGEQFDEKGNPIPPIAGQTATGGETPTFALGAGAVVDLGLGEEIQEANPARPNARFDPFFMAMARQMGGRLELPVDEVLLHYDSSYSAARAVMLQAWRMYSTRRWWMVQQFCQPHYGLWMDEGVARGILELEGYNDPRRRLAYQQALWIGPARGAMDETQEANAAKTRIETGVSNEAIETAQMMGESWRSVYAQRRRELKQRRADGMELGPAPGQQAVPGQQAAPAQPGAPGQPSEGPGRPTPARPETAPDDALPDSELESEED